MAGKMRVVAKLFLGTSVLATAGGGAYYCTTHGVTLPSFVQRSKPAATADLDAVASAWAEPSSSRLDNPEESSAIARSAKPEHAELHSKVGAASGDRYAIVAPPKTDVAEDTSSPFVASKSDTTPHEKADAERPVVAKAEGMSSGAAASARTPNRHQHRPSMISL